jgi:hypothetical protein
MWFVWVFLLILGITLVPGVSQKVETTVEDIFHGVSSGATSGIVNAWIEVAAVAAGLAFLIWVAESKTAPHLGQQVGAPPAVEPIRVAATPTFGTTAGVSAGPGGVNLGSTTTAATGGSAPPSMMEAPPPRRGSLGSIRKHVEE